MRRGWVIQNHLTGQAAANTTRDYLKIIIFFAGNAILLATILTGFASNIASQTPSIKRNISLVKISLAILNFLVIFFLFILSLRYANHFQ
jgi:hypothetical protein